MFFVMPPVGGMLFGVSGLLLLIFIYIHITCTCIHVNVNDLPLTAEGFLGRAG